MADDTDLIFNGTEVIWRGRGTYPATSGLPGYQHSDDVRIKNAAIPPGKYVVKIIDGGAVTVKPNGDFSPSWGYQRLPQQYTTENGEVFDNTGWGPERIRLEPMTGTQTFGRGGFYLHDSTKGYSHGCIEVGSGFFKEFTALLAKQNQNDVPFSRRNLILEVNYTGPTITNGGTGKDGSWNAEKERTYRSQLIDQGMHNGAE